VGIQCVDCVAEAAKQRGPVVSQLGFVPRGGPPLVTIGLILANVAAFALGMLIIGEQQWWIDWGLWPGAAEQLGLEGGLFALGQEPYRWISSGFLHFGPFHLGINMLVLWQFGSQLEPALGRLRYVLLYAVSLLGGSLAIVLLASGGVHGGASGAIFGLITAFIIVMRRLRLAVQGLLITAGIWLVAGFFIGSISWQGHLGGAIAGGLVMLAMFRGVDKRQRRRNERITPV